MANYAHCAKGQRCENIQRDGKTKLERTREKKKREEGNESSRECAGGKRVE